MRGRFDLYHASITETFSQIANGQHEHSFAIIPETTYLGWKKLSGFAYEEIGYKICEDSVGRRFAKANFVDVGHTWTILTTKCQHPSPAYGDDWRLVVSISRDGEEISHSQISVEDFFKLVKERRAAHGNW